MKRILSAVVLMLALAARMVWAAPPETISIQGVMKDASGQAVTGTHNIVLKIFNLSGTQLASETHNGVSFTDGFFSVVLGSVSNPLSGLAFDEPYEVEISINGVPLSPKLALTAAPYSLNMRGISRFNGSLHFKGTKHLIVDNDYGLFSLNSAGNALDAGVDSELDGRLSLWATGKHVVEINGASMSMTVNGSVNLTGLKMSTGAANGYVLTSDASGAASWQPASGSSPWSVSGGTIYYNGGKVGIGTATPAPGGGTGRLHVSGGHILVDNDFGFLMLNSAGNHGAGMDSDANNNLSLLAGGAERMVVTNDGRVGIGTTSNPTGDVSVRIARNGHVVVNSDFGFFAANASGGLLAGIDAESGNLNLWAQGGVHAQVTTSGIASVSSRKWKKNIRPIENALGLVRKLQGVRYNWKQNDRRDIGLIAEEVAEVLPEVVEYEANGVDVFGLRYANLTAVLVEAVKEQQKQIEAQQAALDKQSALIAQQQAALEAVMKRIAALEKDGGQKMAVLKDQEIGTSR